MLSELLKELERVTDQQIENGDRQELINGTIEELGEYCLADRVERGKKNRKLTESAMVEAVDLTLCAISLYFASGGTIAEFEGIARRKLEKMAKRSGLACGGN